MTHQASLSPINFPAIDALSTQMANPSTGGSASTDSVVSESARRPYSKGDSDIIDELMEEFIAGAVSLDRCRPYPVGQVHRLDVGRFRLIEVPCGCWECSYCGPRLKASWYRRLEGAVLSAPHLEAIRIAEGEWEAFIKRVNRSGLRSYTRMRLDDGIYLVLAPGEIGGEVISQDRRKSFLMSALQEVPFVKQPISTSRDGWILGIKKETNNSWTTMDSTRHTTLEECKEVLDGFADDGVVSIYDTETSGDFILNTLEFQIPKPMMKNGDFYKVLWHLGIYMRQGGEHRGEERRKRRLKAA